MCRTFIALAAFAALLTAQVALARGSAFTVLTVRADVRPSALVTLELKATDSGSVDAQQLLHGLSYKAAGGVKPIVVLDALPLPGRTETVRRISIDF